MKVCCSIVVIPGATKPDNQVNNEKKSYRACFISLSVNILRSVLNLQCIEQCGILKIILVSGILQSNNYLVLLPKRLKLNK